MEHLNVAIADDNQRILDLMEEIINMDNELNVVGKAKMGEEMCQKMCIRDRVLGEKRERIKRQMLSKIEKERARAAQAALKLKLSHPRQKLFNNRQYAADLENKIRTLLEEKLRTSRHRLAIYAERMKGLSPLSKLSQGYSYIENSRKENIKSVLQVEKGEILQVYMTDGVVQAKVCGVEEQGICESKEGV